MSGLARVDSAHLVPSALAGWSVLRSLVVGQAIDDYVQNIMAHSRSFSRSHKYRARGGLHAKCGALLAPHPDLFLFLLPSPRLQEALLPTAVTFRRLPSDTGGLPRDMES